MPDDLWDGDKLAFDDFPPDGLSSDQDGDYNSNCSCSRKASLAAEKENEGSSFPQEESIRKLTAVSTNSRPLDAMERNAQVSL